MKPTEGRARVVIEAVTPQVEGGRYPARHIVGDAVKVTAAIFGDGHDHLAARLLFRPKSARRWQAATMTALGNDLWTATFDVDQIGMWEFSVQGWVDHFDTWCDDLVKRLAAQPSLLPETSQGRTVTPQDIPLALRTGALMLDKIAKRAKGMDARLAAEIVHSLRWMADQNAAVYEYPLSPQIRELAARYPDLSLATRFADDLEVWVDRSKARYSTWYELFPRSMSPVLGQHGTLLDVEAQLPELQQMGFDVLYLPPIHPIGTAFRKGKNNAVTALAGDEGSPWAIGAVPAVAQAGKNQAGTASEGGHKAIHPALGTFADFDHLQTAARAHGLELALDIAFQCSPDHPWVKEHPAWFIERPDGTIQYAENPPKKYQDIYPLNFESVEWRSLWDELLSVFEFWIKRGVKIFRVDNPHTKSLRFWEWCLGTLRERYPDTIYLAEAFTRPHVMYSLAKAGFTQSYTYFTWRTTRAELEEYLRELTQPPVSTFFEPNFWPNTPDILPVNLQQGGRAVFMQRVILAATLTANYGIYGPAYELCENTPAQPAPGRSESEEYGESEKYEIRQRDRKQPHSLVPLITDLNNIRRANPALQSNRTLHFHGVDNEQIVCYSKSAGSNIILVAICLDPREEQGGWLDLDLEALHLPAKQDFDVEDLLTGVHYTWRDRRNYVILRPETQPAHIFRVTRRP